MQNNVYDARDLEQLTLSKDVGVEFMLFVKMAKAHNPTFGPFAPMHYFLGSKLGSSDKNIVISVFRGGSKSFLVEMWALFIVFKKGIIPAHEIPIKFLLYFSSSDRLGSQYTDNLNLHVQDSPFLQEYIEFHKTKNLSGRTIIFNKSDRLDEKGKEQPYSKRYSLVVETAGILSNFRGSRRGDRRPDEVIVDDIFSDDMKGSELQLQKIKDIFTNGILNMGSDYTKFIFIGTPISPNDLLNELLNNPHWVSHKYPVCEKFPVSKEEFRGNWEARSKFSYEGVLKAYQLAEGSSSGTAGFYQEMMLETVDLSNVLIPPEWIKRRKVDHIRKDFSNFNIYISTDFASSEKRSADFSAIGVWAVTSDGDWILIDGVLKKQTMSANWEDVFRLVQKYTKRGNITIPPEVGIEVSAMQKSFIDWIYREMDFRNIRFRLAQDKNKNLLNRNSGFANEGITPVGSKLDRFVNTVLPMFKSGKIWIGEAEPHDYNFAMLIKELIDEELSKLTLKSGKKGLRHDDALDMLSQMGQIELIYPNIAEPVFTEYNQEHRFGSSYNTVLIPGGNYL